MKRWGGNKPRNNVQSDKPRSLFSYVEPDRVHCKTSWSSGGLQCMPGLTRLPRHRAT